MNKTAIETQTRINNSIGAIGIILLAIFLAWFPIVILEIPMPKDPISSSIVNAIWLFATMVLIPYTWAYYRLNLRPSDLGLRKSKLLINIIAGTMLYSVALVAFIHCSSDPLISNHMVRNVDILDATLLTLSMGTIAVATDLATRGFLLLTLAKYSNITIAVVMQNILWLAGHVHEINLLSNCLGYELAVLLTLFLGLTGDAIVLKTRSVTGLAFAHFILNVALVTYIRAM